MPETRGLSLEDIQTNFLIPGTAQRGRVVSLLRRWIGVGGGGGGASEGTPSSQASGSVIELRDVGDLLSRGAEDDGVEVASTEAGSGRAVGA
jgi:hypothetical protein